MEIADFGAPDL